MRSIVRLVTITGLVAASATALASQPQRRPVRPLPLEPRRELMRERMLERRELMLERRGGRMGSRMGSRMGPRMGARMGGRAGLRAGGVRRIVRRELARERYAALQPAQREALFKYRESARTERFRVGEEIRAGKLTREQARERLTKWREANKPPVDLRVRPIRPEGEQEGR